MTDLIITLTVVNLGLTLIGFGFGALGLKMLTEYWKDKGKE